VRDTGILESLTPRPLATAVSRAWRQSAFALLLLASCCGAPQPYINLWYDPVAHVRGTPGRKVVVVKFADTRQQADRTTVGEFRNQYGAKVGELHVSRDEDVGAWLANAITKELTRAGYYVERYRDAAPPDADIIVTGTVPEVFAYTRATGGLRAVVVCTVAVTRAGGVVLLNRPYMGVATSGRGGCFTTRMETLSSFYGGALQQLMRRMAPEVIAAVEGR
jgi:uncharacterized lipoprotein YajG